MEKYPTGQSQHRLAHCDWHGHNIGTTKKMFQNNRASYSYSVNALPSPGAGFRLRQGIRPRKRIPYSVAILRAGSRGQHDPEQSRAGNVGTGIKSSGHGGNAPSFDLPVLIVLSNVLYLPETPQSGDRAADPRMAPQVVDPKGGVRAVAPHHV
jgi:hypothetical protein